MGEIWSPAEHLHLNIQNSSGIQVDNENIKEETSSVKVLTIKWKAEEGIELHWIHLTLWQEEHILIKGE